jgi:hypothetical protein
MSKITPLNLFMILTLWFPTFYDSVALWFPSHFLIWILIPDPFPDYGIVTVFDPFP